MLEGCTRIGWPIGNRFYELHLLYRGGSIGAGYFGAEGEQLMAVIDHRGPVYAVSPVIFSPPVSGRSASRYRCGTAILAHQVGYAGKSGRYGILQRVDDGCLQWS